MIEIAFILVLWERCYTSEDGKSWVCFSKPVPQVLCIRNAQRMECQLVPYQPRRMV